ncbi:hypothetical protein Y1Q_0021734 [Alligator mississippiensis]|uniref:Uncharacterized protein n=1 Tax=Alligator mississippiensis TaxID=8496 RepID=A0A151PAR3_ALLMI|nr:hypothetical protein Y1Q_0021734 [Alligator mississippiensis]
MTGWGPKIGVPKLSMLRPRKLRTGSDHGYSLANCGPPCGAPQPEFPAGIQVTVTLFQDEEKGGKGDVYATPASRVHSRTWSYFGAQLGSCGGDSMVQSQGKAMICNYMLQSF